VLVGVAVSVGVGVAVGVGVGVWVTHLPASALQEAPGTRSQTPQLPGATGGPQAKEPHWQHSPWASAGVAGSRATANRTRHSQVATGPGPVRGRDVAG
jgi:hypothetical protein